MTTPRTTSPFVSLALHRLIYRCLPKKDLLFIAKPQPNILLQFLLGTPNNKASIKEIISYIENDPILIEELQITHSVETCVRYYVKRLQDYKLVNIT